MSADSTQDVVIRFSIPFRMSALLICAASAVALLPRAVRAIPEEAIGLMFILLAVQALLAYAAFVVFAYRLRFSADRIAAESLPNPIWPSFACAYAEITGVQKADGWSSLAILKFMKTEPIFLPNLEFLTAGPAELLAEIQKRVSAEKFIERAPASLRGRWRAHRWAANVAVLLAAAWISLQLLEAGRWISFERAGFAYLDSILILAALILGTGDWLLLHFINRNS